MSERMNCRRLVISGDHHTGSVSPTKIRSERTDEPNPLRVLRLICQRVQRRLLKNHHLLKVCHYALNVRCSQRKPMIGLRTRRSRRALDYIQAVHRSVRIAALGEVADVAGVAGESGVEEVGVERGDYVGFRKIVARL